MPGCKAAAGGSLLEISYIPLLSVMTLHYHRIYQISSLEANLSLEDPKQLCRQKPPPQVYLPTPKLILSPICSNNDKKTILNIPSYSLKHLSPVRNTLSDVAEVEPIYTVDPNLVLVRSLLIQTDLVSITYSHFFVFKEFKVLCYLQFLKNTKFVRIVLNHF